MKAQARRAFLTRAAALVVAASRTPVWADGRQETHQSLAGMVGLTTGGLNFQRRRGKLTLLSLPRFVRDELGLKLIDLNTHWLESYDPSYLEQVRGVAAESGCFFTNLKVNHSFGDLYSRDLPERQRALENARRLIRVAQSLGAKWIRFTFPSETELGNPLNPFAHRELARYAEPYGVQLLVENLSWMTRDVNGVMKLVAGIGRNVAPCPDTGNWSDAIRDDGLARTFPTAVTCDFKAFEMGPQFQHEKYDIQRCFLIGWQTGFRGPWVIEHSNENTSALIRETVYLRDRLQQWIAEAA